MIEFCLLCGLWIAFVGFMSCNQKLNAVRASVRKHKYRKSQFDLADVSLWRECDIFEQEKEVSE